MRAGAEGSSWPERIVTSVVVKVTESIVCQVDDMLNTRWKAVCPLCGWKTYEDRRTLVERALRDHLAGHGSDQGAML